MDNGASSYRRFLDGDESAFNEIMEELFRSLVFFINGYVHDIHAAEDIAIDAFSDLVVHRHRYNFKVTLKTYDNKKHWDYISLRNTPGSYVIMNEGADKWLGEYETELMQILDTINVAEGYISEGEAIEIAKKAIDVKYDEIRARFDSTNRFWRISFHEKNSSSSVKDIIMTLEGKILDDEYLKLKEVP